MDYFVTTTWIKENIVVNKNVDDNNITPLIKGVADMSVRSYLGTYFYNDLLTKYNAQTLSADEKILIRDYIKYIVGWKTASEIAVSTSFELANKGVQTQSGDYSTSPDFKSVSFLVHHYSDKSDFYMNRLKVYLTENKDLYNVFLNVLNNDSLIKKESCSDNSNPFNSSILFI
jgi:hypothetical protein